MNVVNSRRISVALENVRSAHNVGSIFRTADGAGAAEVHLIGTTPAPIDRFGRLQPDIAKTALGAERTLPWTYHESTAAFLEEVRTRNAVLIVVEQDERSVDYRTLAHEGDLVLIFGNEVEGVSSALRDVADQIVQISMLGTKESLNVSVAAGVVLFALADHY